jgi:SAM-dependent methyltransferase
VHCTLCDNPAPPFARVDQRDYFRCSRCRLTFEDPATLPNRETEKAHYDLHDNNPADAGYRTFLAQLADPLCERLRPGDHGLDFGCGPGPALAQMLDERGFPCRTYDPIYAPDPAPLDQQYDFVTCTEVVEHLHRPAREWQQFARLVKPGGWLGIMTCWLIDDDAFAHWHYRLDPTHVCFWQPDTFAWLARKQGWQVTLVGNPVVLMQKLPDTDLHRGALPNQTR